MLPDNRVSNDKSSLFTQPTCYAKASCYVNQDGISQPMSKHYHHPPDSVAFISSNLNKIHTLHTCTFVAKIITYRHLCSDNRNINASQFVHYQRILYINIYICLHVQPGGTALQTWLSWGGQTWDKHTSSQWVKAATYWGGDSSTLSEQLIFKSEMIISKSCLCLLHTILNKWFKQEKIQLFGIDIMMGRLMMIWWWE